MPEAASVDIVPGKRDLQWLNVVAVVLFGVGLVAGVVLTVARGPVDIAFGLIDVLVVTVLCVVVIVVHELTHGLVMLLLGERPRFGFVRMAGSIPAFFATPARPVRFTRSQYLTIALAPLVVVNLVTAGLVLVAPVGWWFVLPLALHLSGCVGDLWAARVALAQPAGASFEDLRDGLRVFPPPAGAPGPARDRAC